ncbi:hypothetical protein GO013_12550 [Pseudodesulfovibrio sp. JC047]|uniref:ArnT family glycosyltransferase n=1 Tax=Pseudodesulfovibrio sp. JC047 TaxID=2683199 RepID=UPI0013D332A8|nr:glycosyltransferase family 39 protein [Pseudodesulfovibrio sp. JC047]NDV20241.1 hypothetical protein [Pseudodesulfovibrio sp. JC047]
MYDWTNIKNFFEKRYVLLWVNILFLISFSLFFRFLTSNVVESGGDAIYKWSIVKQYVLFGEVPFQLNHHACRWAINIPLFLLQKVFGTAPKFYYIWPFVTSTLSALFAFLLLEKVRTWRLGLVAAILLIFSDPMLRQGTQLLPMGTVVPFVLLALYFLIRWRDKKDKFNIVISAFFLFIAYGAKITTVYYIPAFLSLLYLFSDDKKNFVRNGVCFLSVFVVFFAVETFFFNTLTCSSFGRMELIQDSHRPIRAINLATNTWQSCSSSLLQYLANFLVYFKYPGRAPAVLYYSTIIVAVIALNKKWNDISITAVPFLFGFLGHAYAVTSIFPFTRPERVLFRYQSVVFELALLTILLFLSAPRFNKSALKCLSSSNRKDQVIRSIFFFALFIPITVNAVKRIHLDTGYMQTNRTMSLVRGAKEEGNPVYILQGETERESIKRIIKFRALYTNERYFGRTPYNRVHNIHLTDFPSIIRDGDSYMLVDSNGYVGDLETKAILLDRY